MKTKRVLCPERLRHVPHRFSWIDQRLVRDGHIVRWVGKGRVGDRQPELRGQPLF
jgi:hypothetical protein